MLVMTGRKFLSVCCQVFWTRSWSAQGATFFTTLYVCVATLERCSPESCCQNGRGTSSLVQIKFINEIWCDSPRSAWLWPPAGPWGAPRLLQLSASALGFVLIPKQPLVRAPRWECAVCGDLSCSWQRESWVLLHPHPGSRSRLSSKMQAAFHMGCYLCIVTQIPVPWEGVWQMPLDTHAHGALQG